MTPCCRVSVRSSPRQRRPKVQAYRLGGDEFCVLTRVGARPLEAITGDTIEALSERGRGFDITTACGCIMLPEEAEESAAAMPLVDERLYADKRSRQTSDAPNQLRDVLLQVMAEREPDLHAHLHEVVRDGPYGRASTWAWRARTSRSSSARQSSTTWARSRCRKRSSRSAASLEPGERAIIERHSEVGERILAASPAMGPVARLVRSSHERFDGERLPRRPLG